MAKRPRRPSDTNQLAKLIVDMSTGDDNQTNPLPGPEKNPAAVALGRLGGLKGGVARAKKLSKRRLTAIGRAGAKVRWGRK